jgi:hypothetical protein
VPAHAPALGEEEHVPDTSETPLPHVIEPDYEEGTLVNAPAAVPASRQEEQKGGGLLLVALAVGVLLIGAIGLVVALGLDGGRLLALVSSPAPAAGDPGRVAPLPGKTGRPAPSSKQESAAPKQETPTHKQETVAPAAVPSEAAPSAPARPQASPEPAPLAAAAPAASSGAQTHETAPSSKEPAAEAPESEPESSLLEAAAPPASAKKNRTPPKATSTPAPAGTGMLTLVTDPYAKVYLGKRYLGDTPLFKASVPAGKLSLKLVGADGRALKLPVDIKQGETTALKLKLDEIPQQ